MESNVKSQYVRHDLSRICQGDILRDIVYPLIISFHEEEIDAETIILPYSVVITQDCDLDRDFKNRNTPDSNSHDKYLQSILISPAYLAAPFKEGSHLNEFGLTMERIPSKDFKKIKENKNDRYHYLTYNTDLQVPELVIDFKHYYTISRDSLYEEYHSHYLATMNELFRERLSQRFANFISRIGLPEFKEIEQSVETIS